SRVMLSSHRLWPRSCSFRVGVIVTPLRCTENGQREPSRRVNDRKDSLKLLQRLMWRVGCRLLPFAYLMLRSDKQLSARERVHRARRPSHGRVIVLIEHARHSPAASASESFRSLTRWFGPDDPLFVSRT